MKVSERILSFFENLEYKGELPFGINTINSYKENDEVKRIIKSFYNKFYNDKNPRHIILGINPGRFGAGVTGIMFTDAKRLKENCGIHITGKESHEPSSVFIYDVIDAFGGPNIFYSNFLVLAVCPVGFIKISPRGSFKNYNYYDSKELFTLIKPFIIKSIEKYLSFDVLSDICFCLGTGRNFKILSEINKSHKFFKRIIPLEHPRFVMQYRYNDRKVYVDKYLEALKINY